MSVICKRTILFMSIYEYMYIIIIPHMQIVYGVYLYLMMANVYCGAVMKCLMCTSSNMKYNLLTLYLFIVDNFTYFGA